MSLPPFLISASVLICERVLIEKDDVISAIRLVDIFFVPSPPPPETSELKIDDPPPSNAPIITAYAVAGFKAIPGYKETHKAELKILNTRGEVIDLGHPIDLSFNPNPNVEGSPPASGFIGRISLAVRSLGNCYVCLYLDGNEVARTPLTIALGSAPQQA